MIKSGIVSTQKWKLYQDQCCSQNFVANLTLEFSSIPDKREIWVSSASIGFDMKTIS